MKARRRLIFTIFSVSLFTLLIPLCLGSGSGASGMARAQDVSGNEADVDEMLKEMPESMPKDYSDDEINRMLEDVEQIDDSKDVEGREETEAPSVSDEDQALIDDIRENPEKYAEFIKDREWLDAHPAVIWSICSDYVWIDAHPQFAARIYLDYDFWSRYPYVAYAIVCNRPFLVRYPRVSLAVYGYDGWFIQHPFIAREVYRNHVIFNRHPDLFHRYYRHREWLHRHPGVVKIAYSNRDLFKSHTRYLDDIYRYRREAIRKHAIHPRHIEKIHTRWKSDPRRNKTYRPSGPNKEWKLNSEKPRGKNMKRGDGRAVNTDRQRDNRGKSDQLIKRGKEYKPDREYKRGVVPAPDKKIIHSKEGGRGDGRAIKIDRKPVNRGSSEKLIKRGEQYKPDREYKRGITPAPDKNIIRGKEGGRVDGQQRGAGPRGGGKQQGNPQGERGKGGGDKRR